ncbi:MAG: putative mitochondrial protein, conserved [Cirrosporium novae-zelandiae]|nr:MAG: putative mitochondrial protein, conserved [Cirrosporium novae-zelandiae]
MSFPRPYLRLSRRFLHQRYLSTSVTYLNSTPPFAPHPAPPRLPKEEQEIFERLQESSTGAFSTPHAVPGINESPDVPLPSATEEADGGRINQSPANSSVSAKSKDGVKSATPEFAAEGDGEELHPNVRRGAPPEFEGEVNPKTGEVGGPKNEPLRWGSSGDWSYNGRVTDF